jgi:hypothetical protein
MEVDEKHRIPTDIQRQYQFLVTCAQRDELVLVEHKGQYVVMHHHITDGELEFFPIALLYDPQTALKLMEGTDVPTPEDHQTEG